MNCETLNVNGRKLTCPVCDGDAFEKKRGLLNTAGMTLLKLEWAN